MCDQNIGVAKRIEVEAISKETSELIKVLDREVKGHEVHVPVQHVKRVTEGLEKIISEKKS